MHCLSAIKIDKLTKRYPSAGKKWGIFTSPSFNKQPAVANVLLEVRRGEFFGLLGQNGAGKTTLVKMLATLIPPTSGQAIVNGYTLDKEEAIRASVGIASGDERSFFWRLTGRENLEFFAALHNLPAKSIRPRVELLLEQVDLQEYGGEPFRTYSTGMRQRLSLARALLHEPKILFLDEPTKGLDSLTLNTIHQLLKVHYSQQKKMTIFMTTHRLDEAEKLCDRVAIMHKGSILTKGTVEDLRKELGSTEKYQITATKLPKNAHDMVHVLFPGVKFLDVAPEDPLVRFEIEANGKNIGAVVDLTRDYGSEIVDIQNVSVSLESLYGAIVQAQQAETAMYRQTGNVE